MAQSTAPAAASATLSNLKIIVTVTPLTRHGAAFITFQNPPDQEQGWFLPNDMLHNEEGPYAAAKRIAKEQLNLDLTNFHLFDTDSLTGNDGTWYLAMHFRTEINDSSTASPGHGVTNLQWFAVDALPGQEKTAYKGWYGGIAGRAIRHRMQP